MDENFLLNTETARQLYYKYAKELPIVDYHNHLNVQQLAQNKNFENIAQLWVISDPYKHRAMRICGVPEERITGSATDFEKFASWMEVLPKLIGNPLYDWSILEMKQIFEIDLEPGLTQTKWLWDTVNQKLQTPEYTPLGLLKRFRVAYAAPCAGIEEDLTGFDNYDFLAPSLRADTLMSLKPEIFGKLETITGVKIRTLEELDRALGIRLEAFGKAGCRFADHALDNGFRYYEDDGQNGLRFALCLRGELADPVERKKLESEVLRMLADHYAANQWTMQLHIGAERFTSSRLRKLAGPAGGFAGIGNCVDVESLTRMLDAFEQGEKGLPNILLFTLNPADNAVMSVLSGSYSQDGVPAKVQQGPAWWWCDHLQGMREVFEHISVFGVLSTFIGMTTDSRSLLSFIRHDYFRRALCGWLGEKAERGELPVPETALGALVSQVCYFNAKRALENKIG